MATKVVHSPLTRHVLLWAALVALAAALRWPQLHIVPPYSDETEEALRAWAIARGEIRPLTNVDAYIGALWGYLVAGAFKLVGRGPEVPRVMALLAGAVTVGFTYLLAVRMAKGAVFATGQADVERGSWEPAVLAGVTAAILMAANASHILVNSHVAWSNCATPLFTTAAFWLLARAFHGWRESGVGSRGQGLTSEFEALDSRHLAASGLLFGLALQTHPSVATFLPGALAYALWRDRRLLMRPAAWLALMLFLVGYGNVLAYNVSTGFDSLRQAQRVTGEYTEGGALDAFGYLSSVAGFLVLLGQVFGGAVDARYTGLEYLVDPRVLPFSLLAAVAVVWMAWRGQPLALFVFLSAFLALPILNQRWAPIMEARYLMPVIPLCLAAVGGLLAHLASQRLGRPWLAPAVAIVIAGVHLVGLRRYYGEEIAAGRSNAEAIRMVRLVDERRRDREPFVVHADLHLLPTGGGGTWAKALDYLLQLEDVRRDVAQREPGAQLRACDLEWVELWYVRRDERGPRPRADEPRHPAYWIARPAADEPPTRSGRSTLELQAPYVVPFRPHSLFDERVPTFDTGCE